MMNDAPLSTEIAVDRAIDRVRRAELVAGGNPTPIIPRTIEEIWRFAEAVLLSGIAPDSYTKNRGVPYPKEVQVARVVMGIQKGSEVGLPPLTALSTIGIINNIPCVFGDGISALIQNKGHLEWMKIEEIGPRPDAATETGKFSDGFGVRVTMKRKDQDEPYVGEFTVGDAKRARLWMDPHRQPWTQHPKRMLKWRAFHRPASDGFADDLMGLAIRELVEDMPPEPVKTDTSFLDDTPALPAPSDERQASPFPVTDKVPTEWKAQSDGALEAAAERLRNLQTAPLEPPSEREAPQDDEADLPSSSSPAARREGLPDPLANSDGVSTSIGDPSKSSGTPPDIGEAEIPEIPLRLDLAGAVNWNATVTDLIEANEKLQTLAECHAFARKNRRTIKAISDDVAYQRWLDAFTAKMLKLEGNG
jgi:hypothetical protein